MNCLPGVNDPAFQPLGECLQHLVGIPGSGMASYSVVGWSTAKSECPVVSTQRQSGLNSPLRLSRTDDAESGSDQGVSRQAELRSWILRLSLKLKLRRTDKSNETGRHCAEGRLPGCRTAPDASVSNQRAAGWMVEVPGRPAVDEEILRLRSASRQPVMSSRTLPRL